MKKLSGILILLSFSLPAYPGVCPVPGPAHPTIQSAIDDGNCTEITLAAGVYSESPSISRSLDLSGDSSSTTLIEGKLSINGVAVRISAMKITNSGEALHSTGGAEVTGSDLIVQSGISPTLIFSDGFESGGTDGWSATSL